jgi:hypothetical protein
VLFGQDALGERVGVVGLEDGNGALQDDDAVIQVLVDKMDGAAGDFCAVVEGLRWASRPGKAGSSEGWMLRMRLGKAAMNWGESRRM